jgi:pimeloyl-ACP methyl ester carboxylesterase
MGFHLYSSRIAACALVAFCLFVPLTGAARPAQEPAPEALPADGALARRARIGLTVSDSPAGLVIRTITQNSAAASAGLREGDVITAIDGARAPTSAKLAERVHGARAGDALRLTVSRDGTESEVTVTLDEPPREGDQNARVEYNSFIGASGGRLRSVWCFPGKGGSAPRPAVVIARGIGAPAADAPGNNPFRDLAFYLADRGFVVVRYDPPGVGDSEGGPNANVDFNTEVADLRIALTHVRAHAFVKPDRIFLIGQGTGGGAAAVVAASDPEVAGLVVLGTIARPLLEYILESRRAQLGLAGAPPEAIDAYLRHHINVFVQVAAGREPASDEVGIVGPDGLVMGKRAAFWRQYDSINFGKLYSELQIPVLNAIGEFDFVSTLGEHRAIADALKVKGRTGQLLVVLEGTDHNLRRFQSLESAFQGFEAPDAQPNERAFGRIADWLRNTARAAGG